MALQHSGLQHLQEVGKDIIDTFSESEELPVMPAGFDEDRFNRGRKFFLDNLFSCWLAMLSSLISGLCVINLLRPLVFTQQSNTPVKALQRYFRTFQHVFIWHHENVWDPSSKAHQSIAKVRLMHNSVRTKMLLAGEKTDGNSLLVSQYDMSLVQCGFMGAIVMYPKGSGIQCSAEELSDYCYFWYGIGYLLGIADENNICRGNLKETHAICKEIESDILVPALHDPPEHFYSMAKALVDGMNLPLRGFKLFSVEAFLCLSLQTMSRPSPKLAFLDRLRVGFLRCLIFLVEHFSFCKYQFNRLMIWGLINTRTQYR